MKLPRASTPVALASAVSLAIQLVMGILLLHGFAPGAVGEFSVIAQIAFYWMTLALAQGQLKLLADGSQAPREALRGNLQGAVARWALLFPVGLLAVHLSGAALTGAWFWATVLALLQLGWAFAQPLTLRLGDVRAMAWVRIAPPLLTLALVAAFAQWWPGAGPNALLLAAAAGYAWGAYWLLPGRDAHRGRDPAGSNAMPSTRAPQRDDRGAGLRLLHTAADALIGTAILLVWQRAHGPVEAGYLAVLLRILGFVPAVTHAAWAQVLLAQASPLRRASLGAGGVGASITMLLGLGCAAALWLEWVAPAWRGLGAYLLPLVCWQASACLLAAASHLPFQQRRARAFSHAAIGYDLLQLAVLCLPLLVAGLAPGRHIAILGYTSAFGLVGLSVWLLRGRIPAA